MNDMEAMVKAIVTEVLARMQNASQGAVIRVLGPRSRAVAQKLEPLGTVVFATEEGVATRHILPWLSCTDMADLALGRVGQSLAPVLNLLLQGKCVEVLEWEYVKYAQSAPKALYDLYAGYARTLACYGMKAFCEAKPGAFTEKVLAEKHVQEAYAAQQTEICLGAATLVTPQAADTAKILHITLKREAGL